MLMVMDYVTCYAEAVSLQTIDTALVAEALWITWTRVGVPEKIVHDCCLQFISDMMQQVERLQGITSIYTTPYHPQLNGLVVCFNKLKAMIDKTTEEQPMD